MVDTDVELVRRVIELVGELEMEAALELVADDYVLELPFRGDGGPRVLHGSDAKAFMRMLPKLLARLSFYDVVIHGRVAGGQIVAEYRSDGLTRSGAPYPNAYVAFFEVSGGRITRWREYFDPSVVSAAFGAG